MVEMFMCNIHHYRSGHTRWVYGQTSEQWPTMQTWLIKQIQIFFVWITKSKWSKYMVLTQIILTLLCQWYFCENDENPRGKNVMSVRLSVWHIRVTHRHFARFKRKVKIFSLFVFTKVLSSFLQKQTNKQTKTHTQKKQTNKQTNKQTKNMQLRANLNRKILFHHTYDPWQWTVPLTLLCALTCASGKLTGF